MNDKELSPRLKHYLRLRMQMYSYEEQLENLLAEMDDVWYALTEEECVWLDTQ